MTKGSGTKRAISIRIIPVSERTLALFAKLFDSPDTAPAEARLPSLHARGLVDVLTKLAAYPHRLGDLGAQYQTSEMWHETNAVTDSTVRRETRFAHDGSEWIVSGPHLGVSNPFQKTPRAVCTASNHYDLIDLTDLPPDYLPRTNYLPACAPETYRDRTTVVSWGTQRPITDYYRTFVRKMLNPTSERTLIGAIYPPAIGHIDGCFTLAVDGVCHLVLMQAGLSSLPIDFLVKTTGKANFRNEIARQLPLVRPESITQLAARVLVLNCLTESYAPLWKEAFDPAFKEIGWSSTDARLPKHAFGKLTETWKWDTPLRYEFQRRRALLETDVLVSQELGLNLDELITIYRTQFFVLRQYQQNTFYDATGRIVFLDGDTAYGLSRSEWQEVKDMKIGTIDRYQDDTLPTGKRDKVITYVAPFDCPDREADYSEAWAFFEKEHG